MEEVVKEVLNKSEGVLTEIYKDGVSPTVKPIGTILSYLPRTLRLTFSSWEKWLINGEESLKITSELLEEKVSKIPKDKLCEPETFIAIPAIQQISYCANNHSLRSLYANLLATSMNLDTQKSVHPAFVDIIKQLTPDEAKILNLIAINPMKVHPILDVELVKEDGKGTLAIVKNFTDLGLEQIESKENICSYIDNLERLKLIDISIFITFTDKSKYDSLKNNAILKETVEKFETNLIKIQYTEKTFTTTNFGASFIRACVIDLANDEN